MDEICLVRLWTRRGQVTMLSNTQPFPPCSSISSDRAWWNPYLFGHLQSCSSCSSGRRWCSRYSNTPTTHSDHRYQPSHGHFIASIASAQLSRVDSDLTLAEGPRWLLSILQYLRLIDGNGGWLGRGRVYTLAPDENATSPNTKSPPEPARDARPGQQCREPRASQAREILHCNSLCAVYLKASSATCKPCRDGMALTTLLSLSIHHLTGAVFGVLASRRRRGRGSKQEGISESLLPFR